MMLFHFLERVFVDFTVKTKFRVWCMVVVVVTGVVTRRGSRLGEILGERRVRFAGIGFGDGNSRWF